MASKIRLTKADWKLIAEAIEMLLLDYEDGHPEQARLEALQKYAEQKGFR